MNCASAGRIFVPSYDSNCVTVIDGATDSVVATVSVARNPQAIAADASNHKVYVASTREDSITVLDGENNSVLGKLKTGRAPFAIVVNSKSHTVVTLGLDGSLTVIDGTTLATSRLDPYSGH